MGCVIGGYVYIYMYICAQPGVVQKCGGQVHSNNHNILEDTPLKHLAALPKTDFLMNQKNIKSMV